MLSILVADEHDVVRHGLRLHLQAQPNWKLIAEAADGKQAILNAINTNPDVVVLAYELPMVNGIEAISYRSGILPVVRLAGLFRLEGKAKAQMYLLVIRSENGSVGLLTEEVLGQREVVVSALRDPLIQVAGISGATELGEGRPVLILDGAALTSGSVRPPEEFGSPAGNN